MLTSAEAAARLGVKVETIYVYVSRGLLRSHKDPSGRRSLFERDDVEALARRSRGGRHIETRVAVVNTSITQLRDDGPAYRGTPAAELVGQPFEAVAELLWAAQPGTWSAAELEVEAPGAMQRRDRLAWCTLLRASADPLRSDSRPESIAGAARRLIATMAQQQPSAGQPAVLEVGPVTSVAAVLAERLCRKPADAAMVAAVNAMLVMLADHELASSTLAVRVAASTRADLYDSLLCGLGTASGPLHGSASRHVFDLLDGVERDGPARALDDALRWRDLVPGFGHSTYRDGDPRVPALRAAFDTVATAPARDQLDALVALAREHGLAEPNVDLLLGATARALSMDHDAATVLFVLARCAGWVAHYLEELDEQPLRFRARAVYTV